MSKFIYKILTVNNAILHIIFVLMILLTACNKVEYKDVAIGDPDSVASETLNVYVILPNLSKKKYFKSNTEMITNNFKIGLNNFISSHDMNNIKFNYRYINGSIYILRKIVQEAVNDNTTLIIGGTTSAETEALAKLTSEYNIPYLSIANFVDYEIISEHHNTFLLYSDANKSLKTLISKSKPGNWGIIAYNNSHMNAIIEKFKSEIEQYAPNSKIFPTVLINEGLSQMSAFSSLFYKYHIENLVILASNDDLQRILTYNDSYKYFLNKNLIIPFAGNPELLRYDRKLKYLQLKNIFVTGYPWYNMSSSSIPKVIYNKTLVYSGYYTFLGYIAGDIISYATQSITSNNNQSRTEIINNINTYNNTSENLSMQNNILLQPIYFGNLFYYYKTKYIGNKSIKNVDIRMKRIRALKPTLLD